MVAWPRPPESADISRRMKDVWPSPPLMDLSILLSAREAPMLKHTGVCKNTHKQTQPHTEPSSSCCLDKHVLSDTCVD